MQLTAELRKEIEKRLVAIEKQLATLRRGTLNADDSMAIQLELLDREQTLRQEQLRRGRT